MEIKRFNHFINENENIQKPNDLKIVVDDNKDCLIVQDPSTQKRYVFVYSHIDDKDFKKYGDVESEIVGRDEDGDLEWYTDYESYETLSEDRLAYLKDHLNKMTIGKGISDFESGEDLVELDTLLAFEILSMFKKFTPKDLGLT